MNLLGWIVLTAALALYMRYGGGIRARIARYVCPNPGSGLNPKRVLASLLIALVFGAASRYVLRALLPFGNQRTTVSAGPEGGKTELAGGGSVVVPAGALEKPTTITFNKHSADSKRVASSNLPAGTLCVYEMSPVDAALKQPIALNLPVPKGQNVSVFVTVNGQTKILPSTVQGETASVTINNFDFNQPGAVNVAR